MGYLFSIPELAESAIERNIAAGLLEQTETHLRLTQAGCLLADSEVVDIL